MTIYATVINVSLVISNLQCRFNLFWHCYYLHFYGLVQHSILKTTILLLLSTSCV